MKRSVAAAGVLVCAGGAWGQSLFTQQPKPGRDPERLEIADPLYEVSMIAVQPPKPQTYKTHDQITIIIDESSRQQAQQKLQTDKSYDVGAGLDAILDPWQLLELRLRQGDTRNLRLLEASHDQKFKGDGKYERSDRFTAKITGTIIDVKPNGLLVIEARKYIEKDDEKQTMVLSGICRAEDVTTQRTVLSSQLADLHLISRNEGEVKKAGSKGLIPRVIETILPF